MVKKKYKILTFVVVMSMLFVFAIYVSDSQSKKQLILASTITPKIGCIKEKRVIYGSIYPIKEIEVKSNVPGVLEEYYVSIGDIVKVGDKIAKIKTNPEPTHIESAKSNLKRAYLIYKNDSIVYNREKIIFNKGFISKADFEIVETNYLVNKELFKTAKNQLMLLEHGYIPESDISNIIRSETWGTIIDLPLNEGMSIAEHNSYRDGSSLALIAQLNSYIFRGKVVENDVLKLKKGMILEVIPTSKKEVSLKSIISKIYPKGNLEYGINKYNIEAEITDAKNEIFYSGFNAIAEFVTNEKDSVLIVPEECIFYRNDSSYVQLYVNNSFIERCVKTGISDGINAEVISGIQQNDLIKKNIRR